MGQEHSKSSAYNCASAASQDKMAAGARWAPDKTSMTPAISKNGKRNKRMDCPDSSEHVRKLSIVSNRNIQLLSMKPRSERDNFADGLRSRRRSSLINLILGAPASGPRFSDDLCSLGSHMSFGIDYFPDASGFQTAHGMGNSNNSSLMCLEEGRLRHHQQQQQQPQVIDTFCSGHRRRRSSLGSLASTLEAGRVWHSPSGDKATNHDEDSQTANRRADGQSPAAALQSGPTRGQIPKRQLATRCPSLSSIFMASIDLTSPPDGYDAQTVGHNQSHRQKHSSMSGINSNYSINGTLDAEQTMASGSMSAESDLGESQSSRDTYLQRDGAQACRESEARAQVAAERARINQGLPSGNTSVRMLHRSGSELLLYSSGSSTSGSTNLSYHHQRFDLGNPLHECASGSRPVVSRLNSSSSSTAGYCGALNRGSFASIKMSGKKPEMKSDDDQPSGLVRETKLIIMLQVCLPFILAGFGNMGAGLVLNRLANWQAFQKVPIFFVLLPSFVGMKGNIEMTLASRLSTLANLNLLTSGHERRHAYLSNLILILSQAVGLTLFAVVASMLCQFSTSKLEVGFAQTVKITSLVVLPSALITALVLVLLSSIVMWWSICLANWIQVNPDNLSTLLAAMYGDVTCVLTYGVFADLMYSFHERGVLVWPLIIISVALIIWPLLWYMAYNYTETRDLSLSSMPPMLTGIVVSLGSGTVLSLVVGRYSRIALYQPVVNGFGANLIAVQASRVSTWLWCSALRRMSFSGSNQSIDTIDNKEPQKLTLASSRLFNMTGQPARKQKMVEVNTLTHKDDEIDDCEESTHVGRVYRLIADSLARGLKLVLKTMRVILWSFTNPSPNSVAARLLLIMMLPAHTLYFFVIWMLSPSYVILTWPFYAVYMALCLTQVFVLLLICEPLMTLLMRRHLDPDIFGISILMALADLVGTLCLTGAFWLLTRLDDANAM